MFMRATLGFEQETMREGSIRLSRTCLLDADSPMQLPTLCTKLRMPHTNRNGEPSKIRIRIDRRFILRAPNMQCVRQKRS